MMPDLRSLAYSIVLMLSFLPATSHGQAMDAEAKYEKALEAACVAYRADMAKLIRTAKTVDIFLLKFDGMESNTPFDDDEAKFEISPYQQTTTILKQRRLNAEEA